MVEKNGIKRFLEKLEVQVKLFQAVRRRDPPGILGVHHRAIAGPGKIYLLLDNSRAHHARLLQSFLAAHDDKLQLVFLPPYSPEFNEEIEGRWREVKKDMVYNGFYPNFEVFQGKRDGSFGKYHRQPELVRKHCNVAKLLLPTVCA